MHFKTPTFVERYNISGLFIQLKVSIRNKYLDAQREDKL